MTNSDDAKSKSKFKPWPSLLLFIAIAWVIGSLTGVDSENNGSTSSSSNLVSETTSVEDLSWIPEGYNSYSGDVNLAWRWGTNSETECTYSSGACWSVFVVSKYGCPSSLYGEIAIFDKSDVQIDYTNDTTTRILPGTKVKLTFDTFNEQAETAQVAELNCR